MIRAALEFSLQVAQPIFLCAAVDIDKRELSHIGLDILPKPPSVDDSTRILSAIAYRRLRGKRRSEFTAANRNLIGSGPVMARLAQFVDSEFLHGQEYERIGTGRNLTGSENTEARLVFACSRPGTRKAQAGKSGERVMEDRMAQMQECCVGLRPEHCPFLGCINKV